MFAHVWHTRKKLLIIDFRNRENRLNTSKIHFVINQVVRDTKEICCYIYIRTHTHTHTYIYIYLKRESQRERESERERERDRREYYLYRKRLLVLYRWGNLFLSFFFSYFLSFFLVLFFSTYLLWLKWKHSFHLFIFFCFANMFVFVGVLVSISDRLPPFLLISFWESFVCFLYSIF